MNYCICINVDISLQKRAKSPSPSRNGKQLQTPSEPLINESLIPENKSEANEEITETPREAEKAEVGDKDTSECKAESVSADPSFTSVFDIEPPFKECVILLSDKSSLIKSL